MALPDALLNMTWLRFLDLRENALPVDCLIRVGAALSETQILLPDTLEEDAPRSSNPEIALQVERVAQRDPLNDLPKLEKRRRTKLRQKHGGFANESLRLLTSELELSEGDERILFYEALSPYADSAIDPEQRLHVAQRALELYREDRRLHQTASDQKRTVTFGRAAVIVAESKHSGGDSEGAIALLEQALERARHYPVSSVCREALDRIRLG